MLRRLASRPAPWTTRAATLLAAALLGACSNESPASFQGYVEGEFLNLASPEGGRLRKLLVQRGQTVEANAPLFVLEAETEQAAKRQAEAQVNASKAQLEDLRTGQRAPEREVARAQLAQAQAALQQSALQLERDQVQFGIGAISRGQLDDSRARHAIDTARVRELASRVEITRLPGRTEQIRMQTAQVEAARAALASADWRLAQKRVEAPKAGLVHDTLYSEGEWVPPGGPVVRLLPPGNVKIRFFVAEAVAGTIRPGQVVTVRCSGCAPDQSATVSFVSTEPEYTPPIIYSNETRAKLVFMVEARPSPETAAKLRPGLPVAVALR